MKKYPLMPKRSPVVKTPASVILVGFAIAILLTVQACSGITDMNADVRYAPSGHNDSALSMEGGFDAYLGRTKSMISRARVFEDPKQRQQEIEFNAPFEIHPDPVQCANRPRHGVLVVHGLSGSPASWRDLSEEIAQNCYHVRAILLPGHGTRPGDLINVTHDQWLLSTRQAVRQMSSEVDQLYVAGFSMGATIGTLLAYEGEPIDGLILLSPAFQAFSGLQFLATWLEPFMNWVHREPGEMPGRYSTVAVSAAAEFHRLTKRLSDIGREDAELSIPVYMAVTSDDSVIDVPFALRAYDEFLTSPHKQMLLIGNPEDTEKLLKNHHDYQITKLPSSIPDQGILKFSHMAMPFSPGNPAYGRNGIRSCGDYSEGSKDHNLCLAATDIYYTNVRLEDKSPNHFKLTFNPYFDVLSGQIVEFLDRVSQDKATLRHRVL